jgi:lysophospholipase
MAEFAIPSAHSLAPAATIFAPQFIASKSGARLRVATFPAGTDAAGTCVLLHGQTEFIEKYFEVIDELRMRGFRVTTMDWRGQGGSMRALPNPLKAHVGDFSEYDDDLAALIEHTTGSFGDRSPIGLAHSMGGHNLLRTLHTRSSAFSRVVLSAPMIAVSTRGTPFWIARTATAAMNARGKSSNWVWGMDKRDPLAMRFEDQIVTSDRSRFRRTQEILSCTPEIRLAGPTWGWLEAAYRSMRTMRGPGYAEAIATPALIFGAGRDRICLTPAAREFANRMPRGEYVELEDAEHEILMENDSIRGRFWKAFDKFVAAET